MSDPNTDPEIRRFRAARFAALTIMVKSEIDQLHEEIKIITAELLAEQEVTRELRRRLGL